MNHFQIYTRTLSLLVSHCIFIINQIGKKLTTKLTITHSYIHPFYSIFRLIIECQLISFNIDFYQKQNNKQKSNPPPI